MRRLALAVALPLCGLIVAAVAQGELIQQGNLRVQFDGRLFPRELPRVQRAPVSVTLDGSVGTADGSSPPQLREMSVAVNRAGKLSVTGLPTCTATVLQQTTSEAALEACRPALVGHGSYAAGVNFPGAPLFPAQGKVLAFTGRLEGRPAILLHLYGSRPVKAAFVLPFRISRPSQGTFGTVFSTRIPALASGLGYVTDIEMTIGRKYRYAGQQRSFLSASCAAPAGFPGAIFQLAKATFSFANGQRLVSGLSRDCKVREPG